MQSHNLSSHFFSFQERKREKKKKKRRKEKRKRKKKKKKEKKKKKKNFSSKEAGNVEFFGVLQWQLQFSKALLFQSIQLLPFFCLLFRFLVPFSCLLFRVPVPFFCLLFRFLVLGEKKK